MDYANDYQQLDEIIYFMLKQFYTSKSTFGIFSRQTKALKAFVTPIYMKVSSFDV